MVLRSAFVGVLVAVAIGCGSEKPPETPVAKAPPPPAPKEASRPADPPKAPAKQEETKGSIFISDEIQKACGISAPEAYFAFDSADIRESATLDKVATCFHTGPLKGRTVKLVGHADPRGDTDYNLVLGHRRADAVGGYLARKGLDKGKVQSTSRGEMDASGTDEDGYARDRRVDVMLAP